MIPLYKPYMPLGLDEGLKEILYSGRLSYGQYSVEFEKKLGKFLSNEKCMTISTYNQSVLVVLSVLGIKSGDEIIASPVSCLASNQPFATRGLNIKWADVDPSTGTLAVESVNKLISNKTKAIFHNHFCGYLGHVHAINDLAKSYGIPVIDDCIEAFGTEFRGRKTGNLGTDITMFSFQSVRIPNTIEGGALVFNSKDLYEKARVIRDYGIERQLFRDEWNEIDPDYDVSLEGYGALMNEVNSFIGIKQLNDINCLLDKQRKNASHWNEVLEEYEGIEALVPIQGSLPNYWVFGLRVQDKVKSLENFRAKGYYASSVHINNNRYSVFKNETHLKGVNEFMKHFLAVPSGWWFNKIR